MRYLGIDYGKRKVGLAISEGEIASPLKIVEVTSLVDALNKINQVIKVEEIDQIVVGLPESGEAANMAKAFIKAMQDKIQVIVMDETLTSQTAQNDRRELGLKRQHEDAKSAAIILQNYLDNR